VLGKVLNLRKLARNRAFGN